MKPRTLRSLALVLALSGIAFLGACHKKQAPPPPPPPPPPAAPTATLTASPDTVDKGQSTTLTWQTTNATTVTIDHGVGTVQPSGSQQVTPTESTTYTLTAKGEGGTQTATTRVTVNAPPPPAPPAPALSDEELFSQNIKDVFFDYDKSDIRPDQQSAIQSNITFLQQHPNIPFTIEGHADERGATEYNLALGDSRASAAKNALVSAGISADRIKTVSYGKEKPFCNEHTEECWQQNRRGHFVYSR